MATNGRADRKYCAILLFMLSTSCALAQSPPGTDSPSAAELKRLVAADPAFKRLLIASIERGKQINPDPVTNPAVARAVLRIHFVGRAGIAGRPCQGEAGRDALPAPGSEPRLSLLHLR